MEVNLLLLCVGLVICFGGIYLKKICAGIMGLIWGAFIGLVTVVMMALYSGGIWSVMYSSKDDSSLIIIVMAAIVVCILSVWLDRLCAAINAFLSSFFMVLMLACLFAEDIDALSIILLMSLVVAAALAIAAYIYYKYAFILVTAFSGAYIASLGGVGLVTDNELSEILYELFLRGDSEVGTMIMVSTVVLGCLGCFVQMQGLKQTAASGANNSGINNVGNGGSADKNAGSEQINAAVEKVVDGAKRAGETASPYLKEIGNHVKGIWEELNTEQGKNDLKSSLISYKMVFIAPIVRFLLIPLIYRLLNMVAYINILYVLLQWISIAAEAASVGILVYVVITKDTKFNVLYQLPYFAGYVVFNLTYFRYYSFWSLIMLGFRFALVGLVLFLVSKAIKKEEIKPLLLSIVAFVAHYYVMDWVAYSYVSFYLNTYTIVGLGICVGAVYIAFRQYHGLNIFEFKMAATGSGNTINSTPQPHTGSDNMANSAPQPHMGAVYRCLRCNKLFSGEVNFCSQCGGPVRKVCGCCGNIISEGGAFCSQCGNRL